MVVLLMFLLILFPHMVCRAHTVKCRVRDPYPPLHKYHHPGDFTLGGIASQTFIVSNPKTFTEEPPAVLLEELTVVPKNYQHILALSFAVEEINENNEILPNVTLGFHIYESYFNAQWTCHVTMLLLSTMERFVPNYKCGIQNNLIAVIGGLDSQTSLHVAMVLDAYKIPQLIYGLAPMMNDNPLELAFYQMVPEEALQYSGILSLLLHFRWMWIGVLTMDNEIGERFLQSVLPLFSQNGICFDFIERSPMVTLVTEIEDMMQQGAKIRDKIMDSKTNVLVAYGESYSMVFLRWLPYLSHKEYVTNNPKGKVWIMTAQMELTSFVYQKSWDTEIIHGSISFTIHSSELPRFQQFVEGRNPSTVTGDGFIKDFWQQAFGCVFPSPALGTVKGDICTGEEKLETLSGPFFEMRMTGHSYSVYNAVYAAAYALHAMFSSRLKHRILADGGRHKLLNQPFWQLHRFLRGVSFNNSAGDKISFNQNGGLIAGFDVINWVAFSNQSFYRVKVGRMTPQGSPDQAFTINEDAIKWHNSFNQVIVNSFVLKETDSALICKISFIGQ